MTWTYGNNPGGNKVDEVRFLIGDTIQSQPQLTDEEILYTLTKYPSGIQCAAFACQGLAAKYSRLLDTSIESVRINAEKLYQHYFNLAATLRAEAANVTNGMVLGAYVGGVSVSDWINNDLDPDRLPPLFNRDQFDNPLAHPFISNQDEPQTI